MPTFETLLLIALVLGSVVAGLGLYVALREGGRSAASRALDRGDFAAALAAAEAPDAGASTEDLLRGAVAAKHLLHFDVAAALLDQVLESDPGHGEAWLERGLVAAYGGDFARAAAAFARAEAIRSDLAESLTLHRAWMELRRGDPAAARRLFEEVEVPLETKLRTDLGSGEPLFAEWFLQAGLLWLALGDEERGRWAWREGLAAAPESRLPQILARAHPEPASEQG